MTLPCCLCASFYSFNKPWNSHSTAVAPRVSRHTPSGAPSRRPIAIPTSPSQRMRDVELDLASEFDERAWRMYNIVKQQHGQILSPAEEKALARYSELAGDQAAAVLGFGEHSHDSSRDDIFALEW